MANRLMNNTMVSEKKNHSQMKSRTFSIDMELMGGGGIQLADTWMR